VLRLQSIHRGNILLSLNSFVIGFSSPHSGINTMHVDTLTGCDVIHSLFDMLASVCTLALSGTFRKYVLTSRYGLLIMVSKILTKSKSQITTKLDKNTILCYQIKKKKLYHYTRQPVTPNTPEEWYRPVLNRGLPQWAKGKVITNNPREQLLSNYFCCS
jgi:hypothetical protein